MQISKKIDSLQNSSSVSIPFVSSEKFLSPKVTIVTTTYNREKMVPRAIESVLSQTFTDFQYLIVNNGCTDDTQAVLEHYAKLDRRIHLFQMPKNFILHPDLPENEAMYQAFEHAMYEAGVPYYMSVDDDDYIVPDTLETLVGLLESYQADIATVGSRWFYPDGREQDKFVFPGVFVYDRVQAMTELLKREKFNNAAGGKLYRQEICNFRMHGQQAKRDIYREYRRINRIHKMVVSGDPKYYFYRHDSNMSGLNTAEQITPQKMRQHLDGNRDRTLWLSQEMPEISDFVHYCELSFMISLYQRIYALQVSSCYAIAEEMLKVLQENRPVLHTYPWYTEQEKTFLKHNRLL